jgi:hypothetical protein
MPYELDNITNTSVHSDAHYQFYKCLYEAVNLFNKEQAPGNQVKIAGLGATTRTAAGVLSMHSYNDIAQIHLKIKGWITLPGTLIFSPVIIHR